MKKVFRFLGKIGLFIINILRDLIFGTIALCVGTAIIFLMGAATLLIGGYPAIDKYFKALTNQK